MRIHGIIHQNISQLKWYILACIGLVMVLPIEELIVGFKDGYGFQGGASVVFSFMCVPLLAGLIACANVQADLDEKRYIFWRSKPAGIKTMITLKYLIGLAISIIIFASPVIFGMVVTVFYNEKVSDDMIKVFIPVCLLLTVMTYSFCFLANILIRSTARSWLIGMLLSGFFLILPFMLPLSYRDIIDVFVKFVRSYIAFVLILSATALVFSLFAVQRDWHLKTNLKSLLWVIAGLVFVLLMLFSSQVANIKVLDEKPIEYYPSDKLTYVDDKIMMDNKYIKIESNKISFSDIKGGLNFLPVASIEGYYEHIYPDRGKLLKESGGNLYSFNIIIYHRTIGELPKTKTLYEKAYIICYKFTENKWSNINELDISDSLSENVYPNAAMRIIGDKLFALLGKSLVEVDIADPEKLKIINTKLNVLSNIRYYPWNLDKEFSIPLVPAEGIDNDEKIKLSLDWYFFSIYPFNEMYKTSIVDVWNKKIYFYSFSYGRIARYEVIRRDSDNIYCQLNTTRPLTFLEGNLNDLYVHSAFVKEGKLYWLGENTLMVFDVRANHGIRKLGHFMRMGNYIDDIAVAENGDIILILRGNWDVFENSHNEKSKSYFCLLQNPE